MFRLGRRIPHLLALAAPSEPNSPRMPALGQIRWVEGRTPIGRVGRLDELDGVLVFLASDASSFVIGQTIAVDGAWTVW